MPHADFYSLDLCEWMYVFTTGHDSTRFCVGLWLIWTTRNELVFSGIKVFKDMVL